MPITGPYTPPSVNAAILHFIGKGERRIVSAEWLDWLQANHPNTALLIRTIPNPDRVGILDQYIAYL